MKRFLIIFLVLLSSCIFFKKKTERAVARVYNDYLYESDLKGIIPPKTPLHDSITLAHSFIDNWIRQKLIIRQAENNLSSDQMSFEKQIEDYKNSLIIYEYESELVREKLDTVVSDDEIQDYYNVHQQDFLLKDNIVQIQYVKLTLRSANFRQIKKLLMSDDPGDKTRLAELCEKNAADYFLDDQNWIPFNDLLNKIPIKTYNQEDFLKNHHEFECQDSAFLYLARFRDFRTKENVSPLSFETDRIRNILLNKRKIELISRMHQSIYEKGQKENVFEIY